MDAAQMLSRPVARLSARAGPGKSLTKCSGASQQGRLGVGRPPRSRDSTRLGALNARVVTAAIELAEGGGGNGGGAGNRGGNRDRPGSWGRGGGGQPPRKRPVLNAFLALGAVVVADHLAHISENEAKAKEDQAAALEALIEDVETRLADMADTATLPKKICLFVEPSPFSYVSGYQTRWKNTIKQLVDAGCEVLVVTTGKGRSLPGVDFPAGAADPPKEFAGAKVIGAASFGCPFYWQVPLSFALEPRVFAEVARFGADLIHCTSPGAMCFAAWAYSKVLNKPLVFSYHTHVPAYLPRYGVGWLAGAVWGAIRSIHGAATLTVAASGALAAELVAEGASPALRTKEWRKAVDSEAFHPRHRSAAMRARLLSPSGATASTSAPADAPTDDAPADAPLLLYVGRLGHEKNLPFLCGVLRRCPGARLAVVGDGPARAEVEAQLAEAAPGRVRFLGCLKGAELGAAFASADVFVMPSETETLGFVVLEAMASGLPVVAVRAGGIPDIVTRDGENGFLYAPGDEEGAARAVRRLARSEALRRRVGAAAREESARWDWAAATGHMLETQYPLAVALHVLEASARERGVEQPPARAVEAAAALAARMVAKAVVKGGIAKGSRLRRVGTVARSVAAVSA